MKSAELDAACLLRETAAFWYAEGQILAWHAPPESVRNYSHMFGVEQGLAMRMHLLNGTPIDPVPKEWVKFLRGTPA